MSSNIVLKAIQDRRSVFRFKSDNVDQQKIDAIVEAARWAPSYVNSQPWNIVVVKDKETRHKLRQLACVITGVGIEEAPVTFVVTVNTKKDPHHYVEDGSAATQNMALVAYSLGLASFWIGVFDLSGERASSEEKVKTLLGIPKEHRVISLLPVGYASPNIEYPRERKPTSEFVCYDRFHTT